ATTRLEVTMVNNLFAENYIKPWELSSGEKCDVWAFYLENELDVNNNPLPQTVFQDCTNNFYEAAKPGFFNNKNTQFDFAKVNLFKDVEKNPLDEGDMDYTHQTSKLGGSRYVAMISENSIANGAGIASYKSIEIPTTDQQGNTRSATPSVGAAEFGVLSSISSATAGSLVSITCDGTHLNVSGVEGTAKVAIYNLSGSQVKEVMVVNNQPVALSALAKGVYGVKVAANNQITTGKIVIR
ncbi:MAG: T9SS type A sorting domain-containing protein, partial [Bacteroidales bacterium]